MHRVIISKGGHDSKKSVDWSDTDTLSPGERIGKANVSIQTPEVLNNEAIQILLRQKIWIVKAIVSFQIPEFLKMKQYKYFYAKKNLNQQSKSIVSNPRSF